MTITLFLAVWAWICHNFWALFSWGIVILTIVMINLIPKMNDNALMYAVSAVTTVFGIGVLVCVLKTKEKERDSDKIPFWHLFLIFGLVGLVLYGWFSLNQITGDYSYKIFTDYILPILTFMVIQCLLVYPLIHTFGNDKSSSVVAFVSKILKSVIISVGSTFVLLLYAPYDSFTEPGYIQNWMTTRFKIGSYAAICVSIFYLYMSIWVYYLENDLYNHFSFKRVPKNTQMNSVRVECTRPLQILQLSACGGIRSPQYLERFPTQNV